MVCLDPYFIEHAIERYGAEKFKPVFPGEHLYLGLRRENIAFLNAACSMADIPCRLLRTAVGEGMEKLNEFVVPGAPKLPALPPILVTRILDDCENGYDFIPTLLEIRDSPVMTSYRRWVVKCCGQACGRDTVELKKAEEACEKLNQLFPKDYLSSAEFGKSMLQSPNDIAMADSANVFKEIVLPIVKYLGGIPFSGLRQLNKENVDPESFKKFFTDNFGDKYSRSEMDHIATLLKLPDNLADWGKEEATVIAYSGRLVSDGQTLTRPCFVQVKDLAYIDSAQKDFDELLSRP
jgi:hypothetical protein